MGMIWGEIISNSKQNTNASSKYDINIYSNNNEIYFDCSICHDSIIKLIKEFDKVISAFNKTQSGMIKSNDETCYITLYIDSHGGSVPDVFKMIDYIYILKKQHKLHLTTIGHGIIASAATLLALIGDDRFITPLSTYMIHNLFAGTAYTVDTYTHLISRIDNIDQTHNNIINIYTQSVPNMTKEKITNLLQTETWMSAQECEEFGFAKVL